MATSAPAKKKLTLEEAAKRLVDAFDRHVERLDPKKKAEKEKKFLRGPSRGSRAR